MEEMEEVEGKQVEEGGGRIRKLGGGGKSSVNRILERMCVPKSVFPPLPAVLVDGDRSTLSLLLVRRQLDEFLAWNLTQKVVSILLYCFT